MCSTFEANSNGASSNDMSLISNYYKSRDFIRERCQQQRPNKNSFFDRYHLKKEKKKRFRQRENLH